MGAISSDSSENVHSIVPKRLFKFDALFAAPGDTAPPIAAAVEAVVDAAEATVGDTTLESALAVPPLGGGGGGGGGGEGASVGAAVVDGRSVVIGRSNVGVDVK